MYYLHWEYWLTVLPYPHPLTPPPTCGIYIQPAKQSTDTLLSSTMTPFAEELGPLFRKSQSLHQKTPSWVLSLHKLKRVPTVMLKYLWSLLK